MEKAAGEDEIVEERGRAPPSIGGPAAMKKKKRAAASGAGMCDDDVVPNIFARLPARSAVASMALSKHHRAMICSPEFRTLHCRLGAPLPQPHIAYVATAEIRRRPERDPVIGYHGFHVTGGGGGLRSNEDPMRVLCGGRYLEMSYANTCDGILVLGNKGFSLWCRCILWNPAVADVAEEVTAFPGLSPNKAYVVLGMGCGRRSKTYKILLCRENATTRSSFSYNYNNWSGKEHGYRVKSRADYALLMSDVHGQEEARLLTVLSTPRNQENEEINLKSLYMDGTFYLLHLYEPVILAVDMDDETVNTILLPGEHPEGRPQLLDMSGRLCVVGIDGHRRTLWLLTADHHWERRCIIAEERDTPPQDVLYRATILGIWDCGDVLLLLFQDHKLCMYHVSTEKMYSADLPCDFTPELSDYKICWGYRPTLLSPASIIGVVKEPHQDLSVEVTKLLMPVKEQYRRKGRKLTMDTVCFMQLLVYIMRKLPHGMQDLIGVPLIVESEETVVFVEHEG